MKYSLSSVVAFTFIVLATQNLSAQTLVPHSAPNAQVRLSEADALRLQLALARDQGNGQ